MKTITPCKNSVGGHLKSITPSQLKILHPNLNATKYNMLREIKRNIELYVLTCMPTKNQNGKRETALPPCLDEALLFNSMKVREGRGKYTILIG